MSLFKRWLVFMLALLWRHGWCQHSRGKRCLGCIRGYSRDSRVIERNPSSGSKDALLWADYSHLGIVQPRTQRGDVHAFLSNGAGSMFNVGYVVDDFWAALLGSLMSKRVSMLFSSDDKRRRECN